MALSDIFTLGAGLIILCLLPAICRTLRQRIEPTFAALASFMSGAWSRAGRAVTDNGQLSLPQSVAQVAGSVVMNSTGVILGLSDLQLTLATLAPMLGMETATSLVGGFEQLLGLSIVLLAVVFGLAVSDLARWTFVSRFAVIPTGRIAAFCVALFCFLASLVVAVALAAYRLPALMLDGEAMSPADVALWLQSLPLVILLSLAVLLFIGVFFAFTSFETLCGAVLALVLTVSGALTSVVYLALKLVDIALDILLACAVVVSFSMTPVGSMLGDGTRGMVGGARTGWRYVMDKIAGLVGSERRASSN